MSERYGLDVPELLGDIATSFIMGKTAYPNIKGRGIDMSERYGDVLGRSILLPKLPKIVQPPNKYITGKPVPMRDSGSNQKRVYGEWDTVFVHRGTCVKCGVEGAAIDDKGQCPKCRYQLGDKRPTKWEN